MKRITLSLGARNALRLFVGLSLFVAIDAQTVRSVNCTHDYYLQFRSKVVTREQTYAENQPARRMAVSFIISQLEGSSLSCPESNPNADVLIAMPSEVDALKPAITDLQSCGIDRTSRCKYKCGSNDAVTVAFKNDLNTAISRVSKKLGDIFSRIPPSNNLQLSAMQCGIFQGVTLPGSYSPTNTDLVVFLTARPTPTGLSSSYGVPCMMDQLFRPIVGHINISPIEWAIAPRKVEYLEAVLLHQTLHVMGFSAISLRSPVRFSNTTIRGASYYEMTSPDMVEAAQSHYGCRALSLVSWQRHVNHTSHWDLFSFQGDIMAPVFNIWASLSKLTISYFASSQWYQVDYSKAEFHEFGYTKGCDFHSECKKRNGVGYFCSTDKAASCSYDYRSKGQCKLIKYATPLPTPQQYFTDSSIGGDSELAAYCPITNPIDDCTLLSSTLDSSAEQSAPDSSCLLSTLKKQSTGGSAALSNETPICYRTICIDPRTIKVNIGNVWYTCRENGPTKITAYGFAGYVNCPESVTNFCTRRFGGSDIPWPQIFSLSTNFTNESGGSKLIVNGTGFKYETAIQVASRNLLHTFWESSSRLTGFFLPMNVTASPLEVNLVVVDGEEPWKVEPYSGTLLYFHDDTVYVYEGMPIGSLFGAAQQWFADLWADALNSGDLGIFIFITCYGMIFFSLIYLSLVCYCIPPLLPDKDYLQLTDMNCCIYWIFRLQQMCYCRKFREKYFPEKKTIAKRIGHNPKRASQIIMEKMGIRPAAPARQIAPVTSKKVIVAPNDTQANVRDVAWAPPSAVPEPASNQTAPQKQHPNHRQQQQPQNQPPSAPSIAPQSLQQQQHSTKSSTSSQSTPSSQSVNSVRASQLPSSSSQSSQSSRQSNNPPQQSSPSPQSSQSTQSTQSSQSTQSVQPGKSSKSSSLSSESTQSRQAVQESRDSQQAQTSKPVHPRFRDKAPK